MHERFDDVMSERIGRAHDKNSSHDHPHPAPTKAIDKIHARNDINGEPIMDIREGVEKRIERAAGNPPIEKIENREIKRVHLFYNLPVAFKKLARNGIGRLREFRRSSVEMNFAVVQIDD